MWGGHICSSIGSLITCDCVCVASLSPQNVIGAKKSSLDTVFDFVHLRLSHALPGAGQNGPAAGQRASGQTAAQKRKCSSLLLRPAWSMAESAGRVQQLCALCPKSSVLDCHSTLMPDPAWPPSHRTVWTIIKPSLTLVTTVIVGKLSFWKILD